jgi:hypothetical protein
VGVFDFDDEFSLPFDTPSTAASTSPSFEFRVEKNSAPSQANTTCMQRGLFESLLDVSQDLEAILHGITVEWPKQEIWNCEIYVLLFFGEVSGF